MTTLIRREKQDNAKHTLSGIIVLSIVMLIAIAALFYRGVTTDTIILIIIAVVLLLLEILILFFGIRFYKIERNFNNLPEIALQEKDDHFYIFNEKEIKININDIIEIKYSKYFYIIGLFIDGMSSSLGVLKFKTKTSTILVKCIPDVKTHYEAMKKYIPQLKDYYKEN